MWWVWGWLGSPSASFLKGAEAWLGANKLGSDGKLCSEEVSPFSCMVEEDAFRDQVKQAASQPSTLAEASAKADAGREASAEADADTLLEGAVAKMSTLKLSV